jgi:hypothetical protein
MWAVWGAFLLLLVILKLVSSRLTRYEDDQLVLDDSFDHVKNEQAAIMARVQKLQPVMRTSIGLLIAATLFVIGYYVLDVVNQFK